MSGAEDQRVKREGDGDGVKEALDPIGLSLSRVKDVCGTR